MRTLEEDLVRCCELRVGLLHVSKEICQCDEEEKDFYKDLACMYAKRIKQFDAHIQKKHGIYISYNELW
ncbi:hypothetical protein [Priestia taiwanensis]|uniref:Uncharacterized protein n=1 Tax=Priestia taiwanensis TaxID=1347902 RepID=A0A917ASZ8_9BACI|nr:hypothetical protein [Priestia taiwanensis]MBM7363983.1 hypothetical protein [Priestia taiwanensis]GGE70714.1 hypothetical protein GCM10007140_20730 [Priestia taiwanensis]